MNHIATVLPLRGPLELDRGFDYDAELFPEITEGDIVLIPFGKRSDPALGVVLGVRDGEPVRPLKAILQLVDPTCRLSSEFMELAGYMKQHCFCTCSEAMRAMLPSGLKIKLGKGYRLNQKNTEYYLLSDESLPLPSRNKEKYRKILSYLKERGANGASCKEIISAMEVSKSPLETLEKLGLIRKELRQVYRSPYRLSTRTSSSSLHLNEEQENAFQAIRQSSLQNKAEAFLLYGVTGSGKTKVLMKVIDEILSQDRCVIYLVPEISLTSQSYLQLSGRYGDLVTVIHSGLTEGERADAWFQVKSGEKRVILGTRSAVFAPCESLGAIIIDEEHDSSFKSDSSPRYHARDVARFRCAKNRALMILSSATPDVESFYKAKSGIYTLLTMKKRYMDAPLPEVRVEDIRRDLRDAPDKLLGAQLKSQIRLNLDRGEQCILFVDRRGYQKFISCVECGHVPVCPHCSVSLTLHTGYRKTLECHYCGYRTPMPAECPSCSGMHLLCHGYGSQKVEEELKTEFPEARILRMDADSVKEKMAHQTLLEAFREEKADILLGTQMVAKGHDFPKVTLVGVVMADTSLYMSDYRAYEHSFSLLTQVIGRAGRSELKGRALIQTLNPYHEILSLCSKQDYDSFYEAEIALRKALVYPPFCNICVFGFASEDENKLNKAAKDFSESLKNRLEADPSMKLIVYGPFEAPIYKLKNVFRKRYIMKFKQDRKTLLLFHSLLEEYTNTLRGRVKVHVDINPSVV